MKNRVFFPGGTARPQVWTGPSPYPPPPNHSPSSFARAPRDVGRMVWGRGDLCRDQFPEGGGTRKTSDYSFVAASRSSMAGLSRAGRIGSVPRVPTRLSR